MSKVRSFLHAALWAVAGSVAAFAAPSLSEYLPGDSLLVVHSDNTAEMRRLWQASPWAKTWADEQMQRFLAPFFAEANVTQLREEIEKETGKSLEEFIGIFNAQIALAVTKFELAPGTKTPENVHAVILLELGGKRALLEEMLRHGDHKNERTEEFRGITITEEIEETEAADPDTPGEKENFCYALIDDYWIAGVPKRAIQQMIVSIQDGGDRESLAKSPRFIAASQRVKAAPSFIYLNAAQAVEMIRQVLKNQEAQDLQRNPRGNPLGLTPDIILRASGLDTLEAMYLGAEIHEDYTESRFALTYTEERGLTKLFAASQGEVVRPEWVRADWPKAAVIHLPVTHLYGLIEEIIQGLNPGMFTMMQGQLQMMAQNTGVELKRDFIETLGGNLVVCHVPKSGAEDSAVIEEGENLVAISTTNPEKLTAALESLGTMGGKMEKSMFETRDYLGAKIYALPVNPATPGKAVSFSVHDGWLILSTTPGAHSLEAVLQGLHQPGAPSLWEDPAVRQIINDLPPQAFGYAYQDMAVVLAGLCGMAVKLQAQLASSSEPEPEFDAEGNEIPADEAAPPKKPKKFVDETAVPTATLFRRFWSTSIGGNWHDAHSLTAITRISHRPAQP